jgi:hypothetical protein
MPEARPRNALVVAFWVYVAATALHVGWVVAHEPFSFDAWNVAVDTGAKPFSVSRFFDYWVYEYTHSNPRIGQPVTYLVYKLDYVANVLTPLAYLATSLAITVLGLGRWPKRGRELALWAVALGCSWFALPEIGRNMFCRAYATNYVYTIAAVLWFLVPLRLGTGRNAIAYGVCGVLVGMCNEHTGPALIALLCGYAWWLRRDGKPFAFPLAGAIGVALGFLALFFAPGQGERYGGIAEQISLPMRLIQRGVVGNLDILRDYVIYAAPLLVIAMILMMVRGADDARRTRALRMIAIAALVGIVMSATLFVSPKLGSRFYLVPMALLLAGVIGLADVVLERRRQLAPLVVLAVVASGYAAARTIPLFAKVSGQAAERMEALEATPPGQVFVADAWEQVDESWWFIGDDFRDVQKRDMVAHYFQFARVFFRGYEQKAPLGLLGAKYAPRYWTDDGRTGLDSTFDLGVAKGFDLDGVRKGTLGSIDILRGQLAPAKLERFELDVEFAGKAPPLPRPKVLVSRWRDGHLETYAAKIKRAGHSSTRDIELPPELGPGFDIYVVKIGDEPRKLTPPLHYSPWRGGVYWILACDANECWVVAATRQGGG